MRKINFLFMLLLIISCGLVNKAKENKGDLDSQKTKTLEESLREHLSESQNKGLDFLKEALKGKDNKLNFILNMGEDRLDKFKLALDGIQSSLEKCDDNQNGNIIAGYHDINEQKEGFKRLVVEYVERHLGLRYNNNIHSFSDGSVPLLGNICVK